MKIVLQAALKTMPKQNQSMLHIIYLFTNVNDNITLSHDRKRKKGWREIRVKVQ